MTDDASAEVDFPSLTFLQRHRDTNLSSLLRPRGFEEFIGQVRAVKLLGLMLKSGRLSDSIMLAGPPGLGKTTLAQMIPTGDGAGEFKPYIGGLLSRPDEILDMMLLLKEGDVIFIDEIHAAKKKVLEMLYPVLEDGVYIDRGFSKTLPSFSFVAATTNPGGIPEPFRDRIGQIVYLDYYEVDEIVQIIERSKTLLELEVSEEDALDIAKRCRGVPRIANRLLRRIRDHGEAVTSEMLRNVWELLGVDSIGLEYQDHIVLQFLARRTRTVGVETMARGIGLDVITLQRSIEPYLIRKGFVDIVPGGRVITTDGRRHIEHEGYATSMPSLRRSSS